MSTSDVSERVEAVRAAAVEITRRYDRRYWLSCAEKHDFTTAQWEALAESGLLGLSLPEAVGGAGGGLTEMVALMETLAEAGTANDFIVIVGLCQIPILKHGTPEQVDRFVKPSVTGEKKICFAITEPDAGTNTFKIRTRARRTEQGWVLSGQKVFITGADECEYMMVVARTQAAPDVADRRDGLSLFVIETASAGLTMQEMDIVIGWPERHYTVFYDDVEVPADSLLGEEHQAIRYLFDALNPERLLVAAKAVGLGAFALNKAVAYAKERAPFDQPIGSYQAVQHPLARAKTHLDAARLMMYRAAERFDRGEKVGPESNMAKLLASEACSEAVDALVKVHGGSSFDRDYDVASLLPVSRLMEVAPINNDMVLNYIGEHVLGLPKSY